MEASTLAKLKTQNPRLRVPIGTKILSLVVAILISTLATFLVNATQMFKRDNLESVSLASDLLAGAKAGQVQAWFGSLLRRSAELGALARQGADEREIASWEAFTASSGRKPASVVATFSNRGLLAKLGLKAGERLSIPADSFDSSARAEAVQTRSWIHPRSGKALLLLQHRLKASPSRGPLWARAAVLTDALHEFFSGTGPYTFALVNGSGQMLAHRQLERMKDPNSLKSTAIVKKLLTSRVDRELTEFKIEGVPYLGAYAKLPIGSLAVVNTVSRAVALETGNTLVRRALIIGGLIFLLAFMAAYLLVMNIVSPVKELRQTAQEIAAGRYDHRIPVKTNDEISDLAESFNAMASEISRRIGTLALVNRAAYEIRATAGFERLLDYSVDLLLRLFGFQSAFAFYKDRTKADSSPIVSVQRDWESTPFSKGLIHRLASLKRPEFSTDASSDPRDYLTCPLTHQGRILGCILLSRKPGPAPSEEDLSLTGTVMSLISSEFQNVAFSLELQAINAGLEKRVEEKTRDLALVNAELDDVMRNIRQGILTFGPDALINPEYSQCSLEIFGVESLEGADLTALLSSNDPQGAQRGEDLKDWISSVFQDPASWETLKDFGVREIQYHPPSAGQPKDIQFEWRPMLNDDGTMSKMMLVCVDITEQKRLQAEISRKEAEHSEQLEIIAQLIEHPAAVVEQFVSDFSRNLAEGRSVLEAGPDALEAETAVQLMRSLHTIKGSAKQFNLASVQKRAGELESALAPLMEAPLEPENRSSLYEKVNAEFGLLDAALSNMLAFYQKTVHGKHGEPGGLNSVTVPLDRVDALLKKAFAGSQPLPSATVRKAVAWLIKKPIASLYDRLEQLAGSLAQEMGKKVAFARQGDTVQLDPRILNTLHDAFLHVIRNSVDHGGETPAEREAQGKPPALAISLAAEALEKGAVHLRISDDGRGVDAEAVRDRAIQRKLVDAETARRLPDQEAIQFIFLPGFSTRDAVSDVSGRGVGMEVLKNIVEKDLNGQVQLRSEPGQGTQIDVYFNPDEITLR